jgi:hypothetical protein
LKTRASDDGARLARDRKRVAFGRLLAVLPPSHPATCLLKGDSRSACSSPSERKPRRINLEWQAAEAELLNTPLEAVEAQG